jgi:hypothetical protein
LPARLLEVIEHARGVSAESLRADIVTTSWSVASIAACQFSARTLFPVSTMMSL